MGAKDLWDPAGVPAAWMMCGRPVRLRASTARSRPGRLIRIMAGISRAGVEGRRTDQEGGLEGAS